MYIFKKVVAVATFGIFALVGVASFSPIKAQASATYAYVALCKDTRIMSNTLTTTKQIDGIRQIYGFGNNPTPAPLSSLAVQPCQLTGLVRTYPLLVNNAAYMYKVTCKNPSTSIVVSSSGGTANADGTITFPFSSTPSFVLQNIGVGQISYVYGFGNSATAPTSAPVTVLDPRPTTLCRYTGVAKREAIAISGQQYMYEVVCNNIALQYRTQNSSNLSYVFSPQGIDGSRHIIGFGNSPTNPISISADTCGAGLGLASVNVWDMN